MPLRSQRSDGGTAGQKRELGRLHPHRFFHVMDREGRVDIPLGVSRIADMLRCFEDLGSLVELRHDPVHGLARRGHELRRPLPDEHREVISGSGHEIIDHLHFQSPSLMVIIRVRLGHHDLDFCKGEHREELEEQQEQGHEDPARAHEGEDVDPVGKNICHSPGEERAMDRCNDNDETLEPHPDRNGQRDDPDDERVLTHLSEPEQLREDHIAGDHGPVGPPVRRFRGIHAVVREDRELVLVCPIPSDEELHRVGEPNHRACEQEDLGHVLQVTQRQQIGEVGEDHTQRDEQEEHHRESAEDRTRNKVRRKIVVCQPGMTEVAKSNETIELHRKHERRGDTREHQICLLVAVPVTRGEPPPERCDAIDKEADRVRARHEPKGEPVADRHGHLELSRDTLVETGGRAITKCGEIGDHAHVPEEQRNGRVG